MYITASISTRNRYFTTLPLCLTAIANQTHVPDELIIFDDGDHLDLRKESVYDNIFNHLTKRGIDWKVEFGSGEGQVKNHQKTLSLAKHPLIWRIDDDNVPEANVLETLYNEMTKKTGAIGGLVLDPKNDMHPNKLASSKIGDILFGVNEQWYPHEKNTIKDVDHLYSTFLFRKEAAKHGYEPNLSRVGHREETIFSYEMKRSGWDIKVTPHCVTWHYHSPTGGIRDNTKEEMWTHDEAIFQDKLKQWGVGVSNHHAVVLDNGLGDHYAFSTLMPDLLKTWGDEPILLGVCYPSIFAEYAAEHKNIQILSIADMQTTYANNMDDFDIYKWMIDNNWDGHMVEAFRALYKINKNTTNE